MKIAIILLLFFCTTICYSQDFYIKNEGEKAENFMKRIFPETEFSQVLNGNWGDTTAKFKIMGFYRDTIDYFQYAIILQEVSKNKFQQLEFDYSFGIGVAISTSSIESVFFLDVDKNGTKELIVIESGTARCPAEIEEYNEETKKMETIQITASCEICDYSVFEQKVKSLTVNNIEDKSMDYNGDCNYKSVKEHLMKKK